MSIVTIYINIHAHIHMYIYIYMYTLSTQTDTWRPRVISSSFVYLDVILFVTHMGYVTRSHYEPFGEHLLLMLSSGVKGTTHPKIETYSKNEAKSNSGAVIVLLFHFNQRAMVKPWFSGRICRQLTLKFVLQVPQRRSQRYLQAKLRQQQMREGQPA